MAILKKVKRCRSCQRPTMHTSTFGLFAPFWTGIRTIQVFTRSYHCPICGCSN